MGICEDAPDEYCGHVLEPEDAEIDRQADHDWHEDARNAVCLRDPKYDGLCVWHADTDEKTAEELVEARLTPEDVSWETEYVKEHLSGAILRGTEFPEGFSFGGCVLVSTEFPDADLRSAEFPDAYLIGAEFPNTDLRSAKFPDADLPGAEFPDAYLRSAKFPDADLRSAKFPDADLPKAEFPEAYLHFTEFPDADLRSAKFPDADLRFAEFSGADLRVAAFKPPRAREEQPESNSAENLIGASLEDAQLEGGTDLRDADLSGARLYQTAFRDVRINDGTQFGLEHGNYGEKCRYDYDPNTGVSIDDDTSRLKAAAWTYRRLESLFEENAMDERARNAHIRKQEAQRQNLRENKFPPDPWLRPLGQYLVSTLNWHLHRHGESLRRLLGVSGLLIFLCGIVYSVAGIARENSETYLTVADLADPRLVLIDLLNGWYFSIITFSTIGYGDFRPASPLSRLLVGIESLAGALFIALFVFVIGRRVAR